MWYRSGFSTHHWWLEWALPYPQSLDYLLFYPESDPQYWEEDSLWHESVGCYRCSTVLTCLEPGSTHLLMAMAEMTGCQPDFRTSLTGGERWATTTHTGMRTTKKPHSTGGRYHMSEKRHIMRQVCHHKSENSEEELLVWGRLWTEGSEWDFTALFWLKCFLIITGCGINYGILLRKQIWNLFYVFGS